MKSAITGMFLIVVMLVFAWFVAPALDARAQVSSPDVPKEQVAEKVKPFLGMWNFAVCSEQPYGVRLSVTLEDNAPVIRLEELFSDKSYVIVKPYPFRTIDFISIPGVSPDKTNTWIDADNGKLVLELLLVPGTPNLEGGITYYRVGTTYDIFGQRAELDWNQPVAPTSYTPTLEKYMQSGVTSLCHPVQKADPPKGEKKA